jgi:sugar O-acyltransferase (sialic acid O-acetyltransferase NeuD family)
MGQNDPEVKRLLILGTGTFAMDVTDLISDMPGLEVDGYIASMPPYEPGCSLLGRPVYWVDEVPRFRDSHWAVCALVTTKRFDFVRQVESMGMRFTSIVHPSARVSRMATVGEGTVINAGVQVATHTCIGRHVVVNRGALIGHHNTIGDFATVSPGANLAGNVTVGERAWIGLGANVLEKLTIGERAIVGAGALVMRDVPDRVKVMGAPAVVIERDVDGL